MREQFKDFFADQYPKVVRFVRLARRADLPSAEDAVQNAFLEAWRVVEQRKWESVRHPQAWIRTVALRQFDHPGGMRRVQPRSWTVDDELLAFLSPPALAQTSYSILVLDLLEALQDLQDDEARAVMAFTLDDFTTAEIGAQLGIDAQLVRNKRKKARAFLAERLAHHRGRKGDL